MNIWNGYQKGINLGGWFSQCDHSKERYDTFIRDSDFAVIKSWGADHVRVPIDYELLETADAQPVEDGYRRLAKTIALCRKNGLHMVLDLHKTAGFSFDADEGEVGFFESEAYQERFCALWENIARRFQSDTDIVAFELLNEVTEKEYCDTWNRVAAACIRRIRAIAPQAWILVGGYWHNSAVAVKDIDVPNDGHIVYNFHCYEPLIFTHQGADWIKTMDLSFRIPVTARFAEMAKADREQGTLSCAGYARYAPDTQLSAEYFEQFMAEAVSVAAQKGVPLYCGEYGVIDRATPEDTVKWYGMIHSAFERYGIGHAAWSYREMDFGLSDARLDGVREELIRFI